MKRIPVLVLAVLAMLPDEIESLKAGKRVTKTYPGPIPYGPPPLLPTDLEAMKSGKRVMMMRESLPPPFLQKGDMLWISSSESPRRGPPPLLLEELEALRAGKTVTKTPTPGSPPPPRVFPDLRVKVVGYEQQGQEHLYTFETV